MTLPVADLLRPELAELSAYAPHPGAFRIRLDANEAPPCLSASARGRLAEAAAAAAWERYPDASVEGLRHALSARCNVTPEEVLVGVGSDEVISWLVTALSRGRTPNTPPVVLTTTPTFVMYRLSARVRGQQVVEVPPDKHWDLAPEALQAAIRMVEPSLVFIASPNNPTGNKVSSERLSALIESVPRSLVVIDEAYIDYSESDQLELYRRYENVAVLRTLSKVGFAALRVGWIIARPALIRELDKVRLPYNIPSLSQRLATLAVTELAGELERTTREVVAERESLSLSLAALPGVEVTSSQANFLWLRSEQSAERVFASLCERGILVRSFHSRGGRLANQLRVTVGTTAENEEFLAAYRAAIG